MPVFRNSENVSMLNALWACQGQKEALERDSKGHWAGRRVVLGTILFSCHFCPTETVALEPGVENWSLCS